MTARIPVRCDDPDYSVACAELPQRVVEHDDAAGAIVVLSGSTDWVGMGRRAIADGARALIVSAPSPRVDLDEAARLAASVPVVLDRPRVRSDVATDARAFVSDASPVAVVAEGLGGASQLHGVVLDSLAWVRVLSGGALTVAVSHRAAGGVLAQLRCDASDAAASLLVTELASGLGGGSIRVTTLGPDRVEVAVDDLSGSARVQRVGEEGAHVSARRFETRQRLALRRCLDAIAASVRLRDVEDFTSDVRSLRSITDVL